MKRILTEEDIESINVLICNYNGLANDYIKHKKDITQRSQRTYERLLYLIINQIYKECENVLYGEAVDEVEEDEMESEYDFSNGNRSCGGACNSCCGCQCDEDEESEEESIDSDAVLERGEKICTESMCPSCQYYDQCKYHSQK